MNCLHYRRKALADPASARNTPALVHHASGCEACRRFAVELAALDASIEQALEVPVPVGLTARTILRAGG